MVIIALAMIKDPDAALLGHVKWAGHTQFLRELEQLVELGIRLQAVEYGWRMQKQGLVRSLARMAIIETINPMVCMVCHGRQWREVKNKRVECNYCKGTGRFRMSAGMYARAVGIKRDNWAKRWGRRYRGYIMPILDRLDDSLLAGLRRQMRRT